MKRLSHTRVNKFEDEPSKELARQSISAQLYQYVGTLNKDVFVFGSLPGENAAHENSLWQGVHRMFGIKTQLYSYELEAKIFKPFQGFNLLRKTFDSPGLKRYEGDAVTVDYINNAFIVKPEYDGFWSDFCGFATAEKIDDFVKATNEFGNRGQIAYITLSHTRRFNDDELAPAIRVIKDRLVSEGMNDSDSFREALIEFFNASIQGPKTLIYSYTYTSKNSLMVTLGWHLIANSDIEIFNHDATKNNKQNKNMSKIVTTKNNTSIINLNAVIRNLLKKHKNLTSSHVAQTFGVSVGTVAAIKANINR